MNIIRVNPGTTRHGEVLTVLDERGNKIPKRPTGTPVPRISFYNRLIRDKDLVVLDPEVVAKALKKQAQAVKPKADQKIENEESNN